MDDEAQALAYARADFSEPHSQFIEHFRRVFPSWSGEGRVMDLGCGPGDITVRFALAFPNAEVHGVDAAAPMLTHAHERIERERLLGRVRLFPARLPDISELTPGYTVVISNSLLHHLADPATLWASTLRLASPRAIVFIMDLLRPETVVAAQALVSLYAAREPEILQRDFLNSLLAAYRLEEVRQQLAQSGLSGFTVDAVSDRHWIAYGVLS
jgi:ubiquinone/menaquinone biosynthesis C-methylase UbiE